jgi:lipopolysaccharide export system permease protein
MKMKTSPTLNRYLARHYLRNLLVMLLVLLSVIYLFDTVELLRRAGKYDDITLGMTLQMGLLKLPEAGQVILPFAVLFSAMFTFWQLTRRHELVVVRAAGFSVWQFLAPVLGVAIAFGALQMAVINPAGALLLGKFERMEGEYLTRKTSTVTLLKEGLWLRQQEENGTVIFHANKVDPANWLLADVMALYFAADDTFVQRLDAPQARLTSGRWLFADAVINRPRTAPQRAESVSLATDLTGREIEETFAAPQTLSFWAMPGFIQTMESTGFDSARLRIHFHSLLAQPLLFAAMILLAAAVSLRPPRLSGTMNLIVAGVMIGFVVFFMSSFLQALGGSHQIPVLLAAWSPALVTFLLGVAVMLNLEDG